MTLEIFPEIQQKGSEINLTEIFIALECFILTVHVKGDDFIHVQYKLGKRISALFKNMLKVINALTRKWPS